MIFSSDFEKTRCEQLAYDIASKTELSKCVYEAFASTPREIFAPIKNSAYELDAMPIEGGQWISSLITVAKMTMALEIDEADSVLEIGCGSGYQAALLSSVVRRVYSIERIKELVDSAKKRFTMVRANVTLKHADGTLGWATYAPFDRIMLSAFTNSVPSILFDQLNEGGILVAPIGDSKCQHITKFKKHNGSITKEILDECVFVPIVNGVC